MKATELRIGNLVMNPDDKSTHEIFQLDTDSYDRDRINYVGINLYKPIPLTEEWLVKFGFKKGRTGFLELQLRRFTNSELVFANGILRLISGDGRFLTHDNLVHVHSLQNLYFALTGEELTIKDK